MRMSEYINGTWNLPDADFLSVKRSLLLIHMIILDSIERFISVQNIHIMCVQLL